MRLCLTKCHFVGNLMSWLIYSFHVSVYVLFVSSDTCSYKADKVFKIHNMLYQTFCYIKGHTHMYVHKASQGQYLVVYRMLLFFSDQF